MKENHAGNDGRTGDDLGLLVFLASQIEPGAGTASVDAARRQGWVGDNGGITEAGLTVIRALYEQARTRSVFRPLCG